MAFTQGPTVVHIKLTNKGRQLLSTGQLTFSKFAVGDSEIDYSFDNEIGFNPFKAKILRPKDQNPEIVNFLEQTVSGATKIDLPTVVSDTSIITNTAPERGFFTTGGTYGLQNTLTYVKQSGAVAKIAEADGSRTLKLYQSSSYLSGTTEPIAGDYIMIKWGNPIIGSETGTTVNQAVPYLWYKIEAIVSGSLGGNNLMVTVDKYLPDFNGNGGSAQALAYVYPNSNNRDVSGDSIQTYYGKIYVTDFVDDSVISFIENWGCGAQGQDVPVWNMSIIFTEEVAGVDLASNFNYSQYYSKELGGFVRYIQQISPWIKKIGVIHYTNLNPNNNYGEGLIGPLSAATDETGMIIGNIPPIPPPILELPTIMWHKETGSTIGLTLHSDYLEKTGLTSTLGIKYHDLIDKYGNVVGKVFNDLQIFVIEDQELLFAMSYKSNRSWTLPEFTAALNVSLCPESDVVVNFI